MVRVAVLLVVTTALGCGGLTALPSRGGPVWHELESPHFVLRTDLRYERAVRTLQMLEQLMDAYVAAGWRATGNDERFLLVVFRDAEDMHHFAPHYGGYYMTNPMLPTMGVAAWSAGPHGLELTKHELTHFIAYKRMARQPLWFAEGIATFYQTARFERGRFVIGSAPNLTWYGPMPAAELMADRVDPLDRRFYSNAWLLTHYLMTRRHREFVAYQRALAGGRTATDAWAQHFPDMLPTTLDETLARHLSNSALLSYSWTVERKQIDVEVRRLEDADVCALRARLFFFFRPGGDWKERAHENLALALRANPEHLEARMVDLTYVDRPLAERIARARELVAAHPNAWAAWLILAAVEEASGAPAAGEGAPRALDRLLALRPGHPRALILAAHRALREGRTEEALELSETALRASPTDDMVVQMRAELLDLSGHRKQACEVIGGAALALDDPGRRQRLTAPFSGRCEARPSR